MWNILRERKIFRWLYTSRFDPFWFFGMVYCIFYILKNTPVVVVKNGRIEISTLSVKKGKWGAEDKKMHEKRCTYKSGDKKVYRVWYRAKNTQRPSLDIYTRTGWHRNWPKFVRFRMKNSIGTAHRWVKWLHEPTRKLVLYKLSICIYHDINFHLTRLMTSQDQFWKLILAEFFTSS